MLILVVSGVIKLRANPLLELKISYINADNILTPVHRNWFQSESRYVSYLYRHLRTSQRRLWLKNMVVFVDTDPLYLMLKDATHGHADYLTIRDLKKAQLAQILIGQGGKFRKSWSKLRIWQELRLIDGGEYQFVLVSRHLYNIRILGGVNAKSMPSPEPAQFEY